MITPVSIASIAQELTDAARSSSSQRAARTLVGDQDHQLRQTVIALCADATMREHESPGEATLYVLQGEVDLVAGSDTARLSAGEIAEIPHERHSVHAVSDAVVLLTAMPREFETSVGPTAGAR